MAERHAISRETEQTKMQDLLLQLLFWFDIIHVFAWLSLFIFALFGPSWLALQMGQE